MTNTTVSQTPSCETKAKIPAWYDRGLLASDLFRNVATLLAVFAAGWTISKQIKVQREFVAYDTWRSLAEVAIEHPELADNNPTYSPDGKINPGRYKWYIERLLIAGEQINLSGAYDEQWRSAIVYEIKKHHSYLNRPDFYGDLTNAKSVSGSTYCTYVKTFRETIREGLREGIESIDPAKSKSILSALNTADRYCPKD